MLYTVTIVLLPLGVIATRPVLGIDAAIDIVEIYEALGAVTSIQPDVMGYLQALRTHTTFASAA